MIDIEYADQTIPVIHGYVIVHKDTYQRWGACFDSVGGAKLSWHGTFCRSTGYPPYNMKEFKGIRFDEQNTYVIKPLVIYELN